MLRQPTIAWLIEGREIYGVRRAIMSLACGVQRAGATPIIVSLNPGECVDACQHAGLQTIVLGLGRFRSIHQHATVLGRIRALAAIAGYQPEVRRHLMSCLRDIGAQALHTFNFGLLAAAGRAADQAGIPCFWEMASCLGENYPLDINRRVYRWLLKSYRIMPLANSQYTARTLGATDRPTTVLYLGVDSQMFRPDRADAVRRAELGIAPDATVMMIVSRLDASKGHDRALEAMLSLGQSFGRLELVLLGGPLEGSYAARLRQIAHQAGADERLHLVGLVPDPERYYALADLTINSRVDAEPYGLSVVESMMTGRPVLAHALGGPSETVVDGVTGWHYSMPAVKDIAAGLRRALQDRPRWPEMNRAAQRHALAEFSVEVHVAKYLAIVQEQRALIRTNAKGVGLPARF
jgi:hypothetical protein